MTDAWDQRCLRTILSRFFRPDMLDPDFTFSPSGFYYAPDAEKLAHYPAYVETFPIQDPTELFAMHENANLVFHVCEPASLNQTKSRLLV